MYLVVSRQRDDESIPITSSPGADIDSNHVHDIRSIISEGHSQTPNLHAEVQMEVLAPLRIDKKQY